MSLEDSRKRKTPQRGEENNDIVPVREDDDEPASKSLKLEENATETSSNLEMDASEDGKSAKAEKQETKTSAETEISEITDSINMVNAAAVEKTPLAVAPISIKFNDESSANLYRGRFLKFLNSFVELQSVISDDKLTIQVVKDETFDPEEWEIVDDTLLLETTQAEPKDIEESPNSKRKKQKKSKGAKKQLFVVDTNPSVANQTGPVKYTSTFVLGSPGTPPPPIMSSRLACFNCNQFHSLKDCPEPKDHARINAARNSHNQKPRSSRYHLESDQKYSHFSPGKISDELRKALGLHQNEVPHYVYLMRDLGYPPGWLEEAKIEHSDLTLYDIDGNNVGDPTESKKFGLNPDKVVEYPGFNVPFEEGFEDNYRQYGVRPFSPMFSKNTMIEYYASLQNQKLEDSLIDVDPKCSSSPPKNELVDKVKDAEQPRDSPSLIDLEEQKLKLLEGLKELSEEPARSDEDKPKDKSVEREEITETEFREALLVKKTSFGTPILKSSSPYNHLPHPDNFSKDVSPIINFENLPNSTGKYEQMTDVLQKVRSTMKNIQNCS